MEVRPEGRFRSDVWSRKHGAMVIFHVAFDIDPQDDVHRDYVNKIS